MIGGIFLAIVPIVGLVAVIFTILDSKEDNEYGANPKNTKLRKKKYVSD
jgi:hypothetical protein